MVGTTSRDSIKASTSPRQQRHKYNPQICTGLRPSGARVGSNKDYRFVSRQHNAQRGRRAAFQAKNQA